MPELIHGEAVVLSPLVRRITAPNPSFMTAAGTNTYLIGHKNVIVIDPGPPIDSHCEAILSAGEGNISTIMVTHTHPDHSPAVALLLKKIKAHTIGNVIKNDGYQDTSFVADESFAHDQVFDYEECHIRALHTPGHVKNHFCFLLEEEGMLFTGDHLMNGSTVVIIPPHGNMADYIRSLQLLLDYPIQYLAPGHGDIMENPKDIVQWTITHRAQREEKIVAALQNCGTASLDGLVTKVYDDVGSELHEMAKMSLWAHLIKLQEEQRARLVDTQWSLLDC